MTNTRNFFDFAGSFFIPSKRNIKTRNDESAGSLRDILGQMNELMNFALSVAGPLSGTRKGESDIVKDSFVCPTYKCSDQIEPGCRQSVYYVIQGQRCMGCDVDICKVERRRENAGKLSSSRSKLNVDGISEKPISGNSIGFEKRWLYPRNRQQERWDQPNSLFPVLTVPDVDRLPPGSENSWITGSLF